MTDASDRVFVYSDFAEARIKHLELIQTAISRLGTNGFLVKGWAITTATIVLGFAIDKGSPGLALVSLLPTLGFWGLDAYFLRCERLFRHLYDRVRVSDDDVPPFYMSATGEAFVGRAPRKISSWSATFVRPALALLYGSIVSATLFVVVAAANAPAARNESGVDAPSPSMPSVMGVPSVVPTTLPASPLPTVISSPTTSASVPSSSP
jgi:hypothetical protein